MNMAVLIPAFVLGMASSLHCIGMCGPLSLALPLGGESGGRRNALLLLYQGGRVLTYVLLGILAGAGSSAFLRAGYQQTISIVAGLVILLAAAGYFTGKKFIRTGIGNGFYRFLQSRILYVWKHAQRPSGSFLLGMLNGLLPCGMVYIAMLSSLSFGSIYQSALFMLFFGMGTLPAMLAVVLIGSRSGWGRQKWLRRLSPVVIILMGVLLVVRGLNLGIPYLSPHAGGVAASAGLSCHP